MSSDVDIDQWLSSEGFGIPEARVVARSALEQDKLTRSGKQRMSMEKVDRARDCLRRHFFLHCESPGCLTLAAASGRTGVHASSRTACEGCGGSDNRRAEEAFLEACRAHNVAKIVIVGGSPSVREELEATIGQQLELRTVDGTERRTEDRARADLEWAHLVLVWAASELHHKVSLHYTQVAAAHRRKVVHVARRGVAALMSEAVGHLNRTR